jgi:molybdenum cofactor guanylyltransferase
MNDGTGHADRGSSGQGGVTGVVLAGGSGRRMGRPKSMIEVRGRPMVARVVEVLAAAGCAPVVIVGDDGAGLAALDVPIVPDRWPGEGPLGGVLTALRHTGTDVVVAACDLPDLDETAVRAVIAAGSTAGSPTGGSVDVAVADDGTRPAALARWNRSALEPLDDLFTGGERSLRGAIAELRSVTVAVPPEVLRNVNTPDDLRLGSVS